MKRFFPASRFLRNAIFDDVAKFRHIVLWRGGRAVGEVVVLPVGERIVTWCYVTDPEGNIVELQNWS